MADDQTDKARAIIQTHESQWFNIPEVKAVGIGLTTHKNIGIIISVQNNPDKVRTQIPNEIDGVPVEIKTTGTFKAL